MIITETVQNVADDIRNLKVKGARNVAIAAVEAVCYLAKNTKSKTKTEFVGELKKARETLFASRPTEPLMRNAINWVFSLIEISENNTLEELSHAIASSSREFLETLDASRERIAQIGAKRICNGMVVFTHCRSSTVTHLLKNAKQNGKTFEAICTETRPVFQGRITAGEISDFGVKTTLIVDSAARFFMRQADIVIVGADAITAEGNVINKIGTATIARLALEARVPFYVVSELLKFDPATLYGEYETIEERSRDEVWKEAPEEIYIRNPAFEVTKRGLIQGIICEEGIIPPHTINEVVNRKYPWIFGPYSSLAK